MTKFYDKKNNLTAFALACGYIQEKTIDICSDRYLTVQLYKEHEVYHVRFIDTNFISSDWNDTPNKQWLTYTTLTEARKAFSKLKNTQKEIVKEIKK